MDARLTDKVTIVTGGSRGIGRAIALTLARQGFDVCVSYASDARAAAETVAAIEKAGTRGLAVQAQRGMVAARDVPDLRGLLFPRTGLCPRAGSQH